MGTINIKALFNGKDVQTGLERVSGQAQRVSADINKSFSLTSLGKSFLSAFAGLKLMEILVSPLRDGLAYLEKINVAGRTLGDIQLRGFMSRNTPERNAPILQEQYQRRAADLGKVNEQLADLPDFANSGYAQMMASISETMQLTKIPGSVAFQSEQYNSLIDQRNQIAGELAQLGDEIANTTRNIEQARRRVDYDRAAIMDQRRVRRGDISQVQALERAEQRATEEYITILQTRGPGVETQQAYNAMLQSQDATKAATVAFEKDRIQGVLPQISSSSLAQIGGGGNVNVFGGRAGEGLSELKEQTRVLRAIEAKLTGNTVSLDPR